MLSNNPDNGLQTDRLSRHLVLFSQDMTAVYFVFNVEKATNWRGVFLTQTPLEPRDFACEVCTAEIGTKPEISRPHPRHSRFKVSQRQPYLETSVLCVVPTCLAWSRWCECAPALWGKFARVQTGQWPIFGDSLQRCAENPAARTPRSVTANRPVEASVPSPGFVSFTHKPRHRPFPRVCIRS